MDALKEIAITLNQNIKALEKLQGELLRTFATLTPTQAIEYSTRQKAEVAVIEALQKIAYKIATEETIRQVVATGKLTYGESVYQNIEISPEILFGKQYVSAGTWYSSAKLRALYPNKYPTNV